MLLGLLVARDNMHRIQGLYLLHWANPLLALGLHVGLEEHLVHLTVGDIAADRQPEVRHPEEARVVLVRVPNLNGLEEPTPSKFEFIAVRQGLRLGSGLVDLPVREEHLPGAGEVVLAQLLPDVLDYGLGSYGNRLGKALCELGQAQKVVCVAMSDVDVRKLSARRYLLIQSTNCFVWPMVIGMSTRTASPSEYTKVHDIGDQVATITGQCEPKPWGLWRTAGSHVLSTCEMADARSGGMRGGSFVTMSQKTHVTSCRLHGEELTLAGAQ